MADHEPEDEVGAIRGLFDDEEHAVEEFFTPEAAAPRAVHPRLKQRKVKPTHYKVISVSLYTSDIQRLARLVNELKKRGHSRANKSLVIREALRQIDLDRVPEQR
ncbi:MAG: hypothetical protein KC620_06040 [Myxococcales bacterium]|nr:hypothetical protein [Myxococcales bacterium]